MKIKSILYFFTVTLFTITCINCNHLKKITTVPHPPLQETYWKLNELMGQKIPHSDTVTKREAYIIFSKSGNAGGNGGCNIFGGSYQLNDSSHITFGHIMSTKMYCNDAPYENLFFDVLSKATIFFIKRDTLSLQNKQMDSTAKFVAVYLKK